MFNTLRHFDPTPVLRVASLPEFMDALRTVNERPKELTKRQRDLLELARPKTVNPCGSCNACCYFPSIEQKDIDGIILSKPKPACVVCEHSTSKGCTKYNERPEICRGYACTYSIGDTPYRPDQVGVAWTYQMEEFDGKPSSTLVGHTADVQRAIDDSRNREVITNALLSDLFAVVVVRSHKEAIAYKADGWVDYVEVDPSDPMRIKLAPNTEKVNVDRWRTP